MKLEQEIALLSQQGLVVEGAHGSRYGENTEISVTENGASYKMLANAVVVWSSENEQPVTMFRPLGNFKQ